MPPILEDGNDSKGRPYYVMPWYDRGSLQDRLEELAGTTDSVHYALSSAAELAAALQMCHEAGVAHRDLKPANVLIDSAGALLLADLGLALGQDDRRVTAIEEGVGSRFYIAPENEGGVNDANDQRPADCYAFGKMLWVLVTRRRVLPREQQLEPEHRMATVLHDDTVAPLDMLCDALLDRDPRSRLCDWRAVQAEIAGVFTQVAGASETSSLPSQDWSQNVEQGLRRLAALETTREGAAKREADAQARLAWQDVTASMAGRLADLLRDTLGGLNEQARPLGLSLAWSVGGPHLRTLASHPPLSQLPIRDLPTWVQDEGSSALVTVSGNHEPLPTSLYVAHFVLPLDGRATFVRLPLIYLYPGAALHTPRDPSPYASISSGPLMRLASARTAASAFADESASVVGQLLSLFVAALAAGEDPAEALTR